ncbi:FAST kinase domain-containing protein 5, mitochondrial [Maniola hyperantus]|uniref:FAST kinase domain-containing protein 5, mitochondrial n=1 Tax=Aphantopus hyperantus TaxID=2795564 RepID=UPI001568E310|nr:FAST kinase domain-containing protein 5, mitochondrial isoform X1 [Maniola hyperantus]
MVYVMKTIRNFSFIKRFNHSLFSQMNRVHNFRKYHKTSSLGVKMFMENENKYAYNIMQSKGYVIDFLTNKEEHKQSIQKEVFQNILDIKEFKGNPHKIFQTFSVLGSYCSEHNICISNKQFDDFIDILTDNIYLATDEELLSLFYSLAKWPETESIRTRNYIEVWAALDDACIKRMNKWPYEQMLLFVSLFYMLNVTRVSDFSHKCLQKLVSKAHQLTKNQIVKTLFFIGITRNSPINIHNLEVQIEEQFLEFSIDELAIIAMGLFKSKTPIRSMSLVTKVIEKIIENSKGIHEVSLAALLKIIRYSTKLSDDNKVYDMLDSLQREIPRLSVMCNVHVALVGTSTLTLHENCLNIIADALVTSLSKARLKDLERLLLTYGTFNFTPNTKKFFHKIIEELKNPERSEEIKKHGRVFSSCVSYLGLLQIYPVDLMNKVLSPDFLNHSYGKHCQQYGREILSIHNMAKIFIKDDPLNLLTDKQVIVLAKKYTDYVPDENYPKQYNALDKMFIDIMKVLQKSRGGKEYVIGHHILSHHQRGDILICNDHQDSPVPVDKAFSEAKFGLLTKPIDNNYWIALVIANRNAFLNSGVPIGHYSSKVRELNTLGFYAAIVNWKIYSKLNGENEKNRYLNNLIKGALENKY